MDLYEVVEALVSTASENERTVPDAQLLKVISYLIDCLDTQESVSEAYQAVKDAYDYEKEEDDEEEGSERDRLASTLGEIVMLLLQNQFAEARVLASSVTLAFTNGAPVAVSKTDHV